MSQFTIATSVSELAAQWKAAQSGTAILRWQFAQSLLGFHKANPKLEQAQIGLEVSRAIGRTEPFSKSWVSRALSAGRAFPVQPATPELAQAFLDKFDGRSAGSKGGGKGMSAETAIKLGLALLAKALAAGADPDSILVRVTELCEGGAAQAEEKKPAKKNAA